MLIGNKSKGLTSNLEIPISSYSKNLIILLENYLNLVDANNFSFSQNATEKAKIYLRYYIFPNNKEFVKDYKNIEYDIGKKTHYLISNYSKCIMQLLGKVAECLIIDRCMSSKYINMICMNIGLLHKDIYKEYNGIDYESYVPISPSFKFILLKKNGIYIKQPITQYNPQDTSVDISWAKSDNILSQLKVDLPHIQYLENAKLQIKVSSNFKNIDLDYKYYLTPIIYFDLCNDSCNLCEKYPSHYIISAKDISNSLQTEIIQYFKILTAYITGISDNLDIKDCDVLQNEQLAYILNSTPQHLLSGNDNTDIINTIINEAKNFTKPIVIGV